MRAVNLIPAEQRSSAGVGAGRSQGGAYAVLALLAGLAVLAVLYGMASHEISSKRTEATTLTAKASRAKAEASQLAPYTSFVALRQQREQAVAQVVDSRFDWAHAFHELGRVLPTDVSVSSLSGSVGGTPGAAGASTPASAAGKSTTGSTTPPGSVPVFALTGCAASQKVVADMLNRLRLMDGVAEVNLQSSTIGTSSAAASGAGGGCPTGTAAYNVTVSFQPLPAASGTAATTTPTSSTSPGTTK